MTSVLVLVTGPPASGKTTLARPLADALDLPLIGKDLIKEAEEIERRFAARAPTRHPGHVDHLLGPEMHDALVRGVTPLHLGGPFLEVDTTRPLDVTRVASWVRRLRS
jgi:uridine kinase